jgi:hypothetical protein
MGLCDLDRQAALRRSNVNQGAVVLPRELACERARHGPCPYRHPTRKQISRYLVKVERAAIFDCPLAILRLAGLKRSGEQAPHSVVPGVETLQQAPNIGRLVAVEVESRFSRVGVEPIVVANQQAQRHKCIQEVTGSTGIDASPFAQRSPIERSVGKDGEHSEFDRAQQRFACAEGLSQFQNSVGADDIGLHSRSLPPSDNRLQALRRRRQE